MTSKRVTHAFGPHENCYWFLDAQSHKRFSSKITGDYKGAHKRLLRAIEELSAATIDWDLRGPDEKAAVFHALRDAGSELFEALVDGPVRESARALLSSTGFLFVGVEDNIPWQFLYLGDPTAPPDIEKFLGSHAIVGRHGSDDQEGRSNALVDASDGSPYEHIIGPQTIGLAEDRRLASARDGREAKIFTDHGANLIQLPSLAGKLARAQLDTFMQASATLTHFNCHAKEELAEKPGALIVTEQHSVDKPRIAELPLCPQSIVVLNCCHGITMRADVKATIATAFYHRGPSIVVGTIAKIVDDYANAWAKHFYSALFSGKPVGEAMQSARKAMFAESGNPAVLFYAFIGQHTATLPLVVEAHG